MCFIKLFPKITVFSYFVPKFHKFYLRFFQILSKIHPILPKDFHYLFSICFFEFRENFLEYFLKILINYLEIEFINKKNPPRTILQRVAAWLVPWPAMSTT